MIRLVARAFAGAMLAASVVFLLMPLVVTILVSLSPSPVFALPTDTLSLTWYRHVKTLDGLTESVVLTLEVALVATAISLLIGTLAAIAVVRGQFPGREAIATFLISPLMLPGLVIGIAVLQYFRTLGLREALPSLLLAHVVIVLPFVMRTLTAGLARFDFALIDAARTLGLVISAGRAARDGAGVGAVVYHRGAVRLSGVGRQLSGVDLPDRRLSPHLADPTSAVSWRVARSHRSGGVHFDHRTNSL